MVNSSVMYLVNEEEAELATPYQLDDNGELRETSWEVNANTGPDWGPAGEWIKEPSEWVLCCLRPNPA